MANTFKNAYHDVTTSLADAYTDPSATTSIVLTLRVTNVDGTNDASDDAACTNTGLPKVVSTPTHVPVTAYSDKTPVR